jgi:flavin reductase (DIM6/NTAB) family NADH-FMN oxidoreductase RutF
MSVDQETFRTLLSRFLSGVTIVTTSDDDGRPHGMTVSSFCSVSLEPPLILVCIDRTASLHDLLIRAETFAVNILAGDQEVLSRRFADTGIEARFDGVAWSQGSAGPLIDGVHATLECKSVGHLPGGDHSIIIGQVLGGSAASRGSPLLYYRGGYGQLG